MGKPGAGICPLRGHSNVQGDRTVGITEIPKEDMLARLDARFGISSPREHGHAAVESLQAMREGQIGRAHVELQSLMRISYAVFCLKKKKTTTQKRKLYMSNK